MHNIRSEVASAPRELTAVGVVIPTCDRPELLGRALSSVLAQKDVEVDIVVVDDSFSASARPVVEKIQCRSVSYIFSGERNLAHSRNLGASLLNHRKYLSFLDDDDLWMPDRLSLMTQELQATNRRWALSGEIKVDENLRLRAVNLPPIASEVARTLRFSNSVPGSASGVLLLSSTFKDIGGFDTCFLRLEDWDLWLRLAGQHTPAIIEDPLVVRVAHQHGISRDVRPMLRSLRHLQRKHSEVTNSFGEGSPIARSLPQLSRAVGQQNRRVLGASLLLTAAALRRDAALGRASYEMLRSPRSYLAWYDSARLNLVPAVRREDAKAQLLDLRRTLDI